MPTPKPETAKPSSLPDGVEVTSDSTPLRAGQHRKQYAIDPETGERKEIFVRVLGTRKRKKT